MINFNRRIIRFSYYPFRQHYDSKLKFVDKFTHFILNIGNFVNKIDRI